MRAKRSSKKTLEKLSKNSRKNSSQSVAESPLRTRAGRPLGFELDLSTFGALERLSRINDPEDKSQRPGKDAYLVEIRTTINNHCPMFFGRYRGSTLFIERILKQAVESIQQCGTLAQLSVDDAAKYAAKTAERALRGQLVRIQDKSWTEDLY